MFPVWVPPTFHSPTFADYCVWTPQFSLRSLKTWKNLSAYALAPSPLQTHLGIIGYIAMDILLLPMNCAKGLSQITCGKEGLLVFVVGPCTFLAFQSEYTVFPGWLLLGSDLMCSGYAVERRGVKFCSGLSKADKFPGGVGAENGISLVNVILDIMTFTSPLTSGKPWLTCALTLLLRPLHPQTSVQRPMFSLLYILKLAIWVPKFVNLFVVKLFLNS